MMGRSLFSPAQNRISARVALELPVPGRRPRRRRAAVRSEATSPGNPNLPFPNPLPSPSHPLSAVSTGRGGVATRRSPHTAEARSQSGDGGEQSKHRAGQQVSTQRPNLSSSRLEKCAFHSTQGSENVDVCSDSEWNQ